MRPIWIRQLALGIALAALTPGCSAGRAPVVVQEARPVKSEETISSRDYQRLREVTEGAAVPTTSRLHG